MTILFIADSIFIGGKERRMLELIKSLSQQRDYSIILLNLTGSFANSYYYQLEIEYFEVKRNTKLTLSPFFKINSILRKYKPDIVHSWGSMGSIYLLPLLIFRKFRFINDIIADAPAHLKWYSTYYLRARLTFLFSDVIVSNSIAGIDSYKAPRHKSLCIYNGIDMNRFENLPDLPLMKRRLGIEQFSSIVGMIGAFQERKDYSTLIESAKNIINLKDDVCFLLIGEGELRKSLEESVPGKYKQNIFFLGGRKDVEAIIQTFDIGILCTNTGVHGEGVSNAILEYMSLKKPVIATKGGGTNEVILDNYNGFLIPGKSPDALFEKIIYLINHKDIAKMMGENGYSIIKKKFLITRMRDSYIKIYYKD